MVVGEEVIIELANLERMVVKGDWVEFGFRG